MLDCLPEAEDWSPESQYAFLCDHLEAMFHHVVCLQAASQQGLEALDREQSHWQELNQRTRQAHQQLLQLLQLSPEQRARLSQDIEPGR
jgi:signal transduction histidine kinase